MIDSTYADLSDFLQAANENQNEDYDNVPASPSYSDENPLLENLHPDSPQPVNNVPVTFPIQSPEHNQITECVLNSLSRGRNLLIECPPGHQRRSIIVGAALEYLRWRRNQENENFDIHIDLAPHPTRIIFATQDITETKSLLKEMRNTLCSAPSTTLENIRLAVIDHRKSLCVNDNLRSLRNVSRECYQLVRNHYHNNRMRAGNVRQGQELPECPYYAPQTPSQFSFIEPSLNDLNPYVIRDIEEFISEGGDVPHCPFYTSLRNTPAADLVICPHDILLNSDLREKYKINVDGAIVIVDNGFNLDFNSCLEASLEFNAGNLTVISRTLRSILEAGFNADNNLHEAITLLLNTTVSLATLLQREDMGPPPPLDEDEEEEEPNASSQNQNEEQNAVPSFQTAAHQALQDLQQVEHYFMLIKSRLESHHLTNTDMDSQLPHIVFQKMLKFLRITLLFLANQNNFSVRMGIRAVSRGRDETERVLKILCVNPAIVFEPVGGTATSVIVGGDCLAPYYTFEDTKVYGLGVAFDDTEKIVHTDVISDRFLYCSCECGPTNRTFTVDYDSRANPNVQKEVIRGLVEICRKVPHGIIILFASEVFTTEMLTQTDLVGQVKEFKHVISIQESVHRDISTRLEEYKRLSGSHEEGKSGAILITHYGKPCENLKLNGSQVRAFVNVGVPIRSWNNDEHMIAKRNFFDNQHGPQSIENKRWYWADAYHNMNQTFAHVFDGGSEDWGVVILLDARLYPKGPFDKENDWLPMWVQQRNKSCFQGAGGFARMMEKIEEIVAIN